MLDHDPGETARALSDRHLQEGLYAYAQTLAFAWHDLHNDAYAPMVDLITATPWMSWVVLADGPALDARSLFPGEDPKTHWRLFGQRIPSRRHGLPDANDEWVIRAGGNYRWLWRLSLEMCVEYKRRFGSLHVATASIWTMEVLPFCLGATEDQWSEPPVLHRLLQVTEGFVDAVASNRRFYNVYHDQLGWTVRKPPTWLQPEQIAAEPD
jgi:hypothetical protein